MEFSGLVCIQAKRNADDNYRHHTSDNLVFLVLRSSVRCYVTTGSGHQFGAGVRASL